MIRLSNRPTVTSETGRNAICHYHEQATPSSANGSSTRSTITATATPLANFHQREAVVVTNHPASSSLTSPSPSKKRFQRLRVRSLSRTRTPKADREPPVRREDSVPDSAPSTPSSVFSVTSRDLASPMTRRRNNSAGNLYAVDRQQQQLYSHTPASPGLSLSRASRSTLNLFQDAQRNTLRHLSKSWDSLTRFLELCQKLCEYNRYLQWGDFDKMADGRTCQIVLLDGRKIEILVQPKLLAEELLDIVCSHYNLKEKEYFGLSHQDDLGCFSWLQLDRKVLEHDFIAGQKKHKFLVLHFMVKFFVESITHLRESVTVELFYLQARLLVLKGVIQIEQETAFELAAYGLQASYGDYIDVETTEEHLKKAPALSARIVKEAASPRHCEERIVDYYKQRKDVPRGDAIVHYMTIIESLSTYGIHYYDVTDKCGASYLLGISCKGLGQYKTTDKRIPERVFNWKDLGNLFFRDKKFSVEVLEARRVVHALSSINLYEDAVEEASLQSDELTNAISDPTTQVSVSRRTFTPGQLTVHVWFAATPALAKTIWSMAAAQHQFYLGRKKAENTAIDQRPPAEIARDLTNATGLYWTSEAARNRSGSVCSSYSYRIVRDGSLTSGFASDDSISQMSDTEKKDMYQTAKSKKDGLEETLAAKLLRLKELCLEEAHITGELPPETPLKQGEPPPQVRRRVGTSFELSSNRVDSESLTTEDKDLADLELHYELQMNIAKAAERLLNDAGGKTIRRQRKQAYRKEHAKLKEIEKRLKDMRILLDRDPPSLDARDLQISHSSSISSGLGDSSSLQSFSRPPHSPALSLRSSASRSSMSIPEVSSAPPSRSTSNNNFRNNGYTPSNVYQTGTRYRHQQYPTLSPGSVAEAPNSSDLFLDRQPSPLSSLPARTPVIINHKILIESPTVPTVASSQSLSISHPRPAFSGLTGPVHPPRSSSWDRSRLHGVRKSPAPFAPTVGDDVKYATLENRRSRVRPPQWQETSSIDYHRLPATASSPSPVCYTAELTKPYEMTDYYKYSNRVRKLSRTTPDSTDGGPLRPGSSTGNAMVDTHAYPLSPAQSNLAFRHPVCESPGAGSSSSARSDRTVSPKVQTISSQMFVAPRAMQCLPVGPRVAARETQITWNDEGVTKQPTIV